MLLGVAALVNSAMSIWNASRGESEARQSLELALDQIGRAIRGASNVLHVSSTVLALDVDPSLDRNGDGYPDVDNNKNGLIDEEVMDLKGFLFAADKLPPDVTKDWSPGIQDVDDDQDGKLDGSDIENRSNNEVDLTFSSKDFSSAWQANGPDWLDVILFEKNGANLRMAFPNANPGSSQSNSATWSRVVMLDNLTSMVIVRQAKGSGKLAQDLLSVKLCVSVPGQIAGTTSRADICSQRLWRVGSPL